MKKAQNVLVAFKRIHPKLRKDMTLEITQQKLVIELVRETGYKKETIEKWLSTLQELGYIHQIGIGTGIFKICYHTDMVGVFEDPYQQELEVK